MFRPAHLLLDFMKRKPMDEVSNHEFQAVVQTQIERELTRTVKGGEPMAQAAESPHRMQGL